MRGRVTLLFFSFLLLGSTATPQCNFQFDKSTQFRSSYVDLAIDGNDLWAATIYGVSLFDRSVDPPRFIASIAVPATTRAVEAKDGTAFAGSGSSVYAIRRSGSRLQIVSTFATNAAVNDILAVSNALFVATASGIDVFDTAAPLVRRTALQTSTNNVTALATAEGIVYAADGDSSVERFITIPSILSLPALTSLGAPISVATANNRVFISDGQQTDVFPVTSTIRITTLPYGGTAVAGLDDMIFLAGNGRRLRAFDIGAANEPVELFATDVIPTGGTVNRVAALRLTPSRLYVAGGDTGLSSYDIAQFHAPWPVRHYPTGSVSSVLVTPANVYATNASGGITDLIRSSSGSLLVSRTWATASQHLIHDFGDDFLLTSAGAQLTEWTVRSNPPVAVSSATFPAAIAGAVRNGMTAYALLADGSLWSADLRLEKPAPVRVNVPAATYIARSDAGIAFALVGTDGTTTIRFHRNGDLSATPISATIPGLTSSLALGGSRAAVFTFQGISVADFSSSVPGTKVLPQSTGFLIHDLAISDSKLVAVSDAAVRTWDLGTNRFERHVDLPAGARSIAAAGYAAVGTESGLAVVNYGAATELPMLTGNTSGNDYYRKAVASSRHLYLLDANRVLAFETDFSTSPHWVTTISAPGVLDIAASDTALFTLTSGGGINAYSPAGVPLASTTLREGTDAVPLAIAAVGGAPWVSLSRGCVTTGCEKKTLVLDPQSLVTTATLEGGVVDVSVSGTTAYALFDLPSVTRTYRISDPLHPSVAGTRDSETGVVSIAGFAGSAFALGTRVYEYPDSLLTKTERLDPITPATSSRIRVDGGCGVVTGRSAGADTFGIPGWTFAGSQSIPANARSIILTPQRLIILTDYSVEMWSRGPKPAPGRRHAAN